MRIIINGETRSCKEPATVADILQDMQIEGRIAVEINREILPRSQFAQHQLCDGDVLEIVHAIGGG